MSIRVKFRAEAEHDVSELKKLLPPAMCASMKICPLFTEPFTPPDVEVEIDLVEPYSVRSLRETMRSVEDGHVMVESMDEIDLYDSERYDDEERAAMDYVADFARKLLDS